MSEQYDNTRAEVRYVPIRHDVMHVLIALFGLLDDMMDPVPNTKRWVRNAKLLNEATDAVAEGQWERFVESVHAHHAVMCEGEEEAPKESRVVQLNLNRERMILLLVYDAFCASVVIGEDISGALAMRDQMARQVLANPNEAIELQKELHLTAQSAWGTELGLKLF